LKAHETDYTLEDPNDLCFAAVRDFSSEFAFLRRRFFSAEFSIHDASGAGKQRNVCDRRQQ
jgi:hypothetical protein